MATPANMHTMIDLRSKKTNDISVIYDVCRCNGLQVATCSSQDKGIGAKSRKQIDEENLKAWVNHEVCCDLLILGPKNQH